MFNLKKKKPSNPAWQATMKKLNADLAAQDRQIAMVQDHDSCYADKADKYIQKAITKEEALKQEVAPMQDDDPFHNARLPRQKQPGFCR